MIAVIAEKPSVARDLARVMGATKKGDGYIEGNGYIFTYAFGHLVELCHPEIYGYKKFEISNLPMLPDPFKLSVTQKRVGKDYKDDPGAKKQLEVIRSVFNRCSEIIVATDAGREGELIFRYIYSYLGCKKPFKRLWISSQTDKAIKKGFESLKPGVQFDNLYHAAKSRKEADWLVGINATQALTLSAGKGTYSIGRVQTPTLAMICKRFIDHTQFRVETYFQLELSHNHKSIPFKSISKEKWSSVAEADTVLAKVRAKGEAKVLLVEDKKRIEPAPLLYDLTSLQQDANKWYGFSAEKTLSIAQKLYERKLITYPRTGSRYISEDVFESVNELIQKTSTHKKLGASARNLVGAKLNKRSVNDSKVTDHHALIRTENDPSDVTDDEMVIYDIILRRMLEAFSEACVKKVTTVDLEAEVGFVAKGTVIIEAGWRAVAGAENDDPDGEGENGMPLPELVSGDSIEITAADTQEKQTVPPALYTEATLLGAMETAGREMEDEEAREAMKESGIGTQATRASIIEILLTRGYIARKKKSLIPLEKGLVVYALIKDKSIGRPALTGDWEKHLRRVERGELGAEQFMSGIRNYTTALTHEFLNGADSIRKFSQESDQQRQHTCPKCKGETFRIFKKAGSCTDKECGFVIFRTVAKKDLSDRQILDLVLKGRTGVIKKFTNSTGKHFDAHLIVGEDFKVKFDFPKTKR